MLEATGQNMLSVVGQDILAELRRRCHLADGRVAVVQREDSVNHWPELVSVDQLQHRGKVCRRSHSGTDQMELFPEQLEQIDLLWRTSCGAIIDNSSTGVCQIQKSFVPGAAGAIDDQTWRPDVFRHLLPPVFIGVVEPAIRSQFYRRFNLGC
jgi:hypothetical protein